jgi:hypothetical protein
MSILASLTFALAAVAVVVALRLTLVQFAGAALSNLGALRGCGDAREFRVTTVGLVTRAVSGNVRRIGMRKAAPEALKPTAGYRAAA